MNIKLLSGSGYRTKVVALVAAVTMTGAVAAIPFAAVAESTADTIAQLTAQIAALQTQLAALSGGGSTSTGGAGKCSFTRALTVGVSGDDVMCLQVYLNGNGYKIAASGAGSPGNETKYFGGLTKAAVAKWQAANGVSPAVGYFGSISRAKYDSLVVGTTPSPTPTPTPGPTPTPAGSGLTVSAPVDQPVAQLAPASAARVPFVNFILTASSDGDVKVSSVSIERQGPADDANFDGVLLLDENGSQIGLSKTLTSEHKVALNEPFTVQAGTSKKLTVAANMAGSGTIQAGQIGKLAVTGVDAGTSKVNGSFPIAGNGMTMNSTLTIGSVTMSIGSLDPGAANTKDVGTKGYYLGSVKASVGSAEDVRFDSIRFNQAGSAATTDLENVMVKVGDKDYPVSATSNGKYYVATFPGGVEVKKGGNIEFSIKADLVNGSARTVDMDILRKSDIVVFGKSFGYYIIVGGGSSGSASAGGFSSNQEPFFNAYAATINKGSVLVSSSNFVPAGNIPIDVENTVLGAFTFDVKGEPMQFSSVTLNFTFTGTGTSSNLTNVALYTKDGAIVAGPKNPSSGVVTWTDTWTAPIGVNTYVVKGRLSTTFATNDTITVGTNAGSNSTVKGQTTGLSITPTPSTLVNANGQTVKGAALSVSVSPTPFAQNVVRGVNGYTFATYIFDATQSGEDVRVNTVQLRDTLDAAGSGDEINSCILYDGATAINTGSDVVNPSDPSGTSNDVNFTLTAGLIIPKGTVKQVNLKCNIASSAANASTHSWGITTANTATPVTSVGASTGASITEGITTGAGQTMTVRTAGSFNVVKDASAPSSQIVLSGKTNVPVNVIKFHATNEAINITDLTLTYSSSTASTSDFKKVTLWDGATKLGEAVWAGSALNATTSFITPFVVPKDGDKLMTIATDVADIDAIATTSAGRLLAIDYNGVSSSTGVGQSSGARLGSSSGSNTSGASHQIMKSVPTVEKLAVPSSTLPQNNAILYRFKVTADAAGPIALYRVTFRVSSSSVSATTSNFNLYAYKDEQFSVRAYDNNPLAPQNVDCVGLSDFENYSGTCGTNTSVGSAHASTSATSSEIVFYFAPSANVASTSEAIQVPAGAVRYFQLTGDITNPNSGTGNSIQISLLGDPQRPARRNTTNATDWGDGIFADNGRGTLATAIEVSMQSAANNFVWSPMSTTTTLTGATSTPDWTSGFLVPGLPSIGLNSTSFSN